MRVIVPLFSVLCLLSSALGADLVRPDPAVTPGRVALTAKGEVCTKRWGLDRRHVTIKMKKQVAAWYHVIWARRANYEFDHLVPRELGGADDVRNIWPQPRSGQFNARMKDHLENALHRMVCAGRVPLAEAQTRIATDWIGAYRQYVGH